MKARLSVASIVLISVPANRGWRFLPLPNTSHPCLIREFRFKSRMHIEGNQACIPPGCARKISAPSMRGTVRVDMRRLEFAFPLPAPTRAQSTIAKWSMKASHSRKGHTTATIPPSMRSASYDSILERLSPEYNAQNTLKSFTDWPQCSIPRAQNCHWV